MRLLTLIFVSLLNLLALNAAMAQDDGGYSKMAPLPSSAMEDGAPITLSPDGPAVIQLSEDAASIIVGNPAQATAVLENPRLIMLMPQQPGATKIIALDRNGKTLLNRHVLVGGNRSNFIRVNKICNQAAGQSCKPASMYYCPDRCYETTMAQPGSDVTTATGDNARPVDNTAVPPAATAEGDSTDAPEIPESVGENPISLDESAQ